MAILPVNLNLENNKQNNSKSKSVSFGIGNPIVTVMEGVDRGGYIATFVVQDGCGFVAPRVGTGLYRNREETGEYNWKFASMEAIRELLSGPCMVVIPALMLWGARKHFGTANDVPIKFIDQFSDDFAHFAKGQADLTNPAKLKKNYYHNVIENVLSSATDNRLKGKELNNQVQHFVEQIYKIENAPKKSFLKVFFNKKVEGSSQDLKGELIKEFITLRKKYSGSSMDPLSFNFVTQDKTGKKSKSNVLLDRFLNHLNNFTGDVTNVVSKNFNKSSGSVETFVEAFKHKRVASRFMLILGMDAAVAAFLAFVPKLYKQKGGNPGLKGLVDNSPENQKSEKEGK